MLLLLLLLLLPLLLLLLLLFLLLPLSMLLPRMICATNIVASWCVIPYACRRSSCSCVVVPFLGVISCPQLQPTPAQRLVALQPVMDIAAATSAAPA